MEQSWATQRALAVATRRSYKLIPTAFLGKILKTRMIFPKRPGNLNNDNAKNPRLARFLAWPGCHLPSRYKTRLSGFCT